MPYTASEQDNADTAKYQEELKGRESELSNGPVQNRSCTDIPCCLVFVVFVVGFVVSAFYGIANGNPRNLVVGWDSDNNACGHAAGYEDH